MSVRCSVAPCIIYSRQSAGHVTGACREVNRSDGTKQEPSGFGVSRLNGGRGEENPVHVPDPDGVTIHHVPIIVEKTECRHRDRRRQIELPPYGVVAVITPSESSGLQGHSVRLRHPRQAEPEYRKY
ncbi:MAG: hypothetical protein FJ135_07770 [Deltaproteobacteria bacterium]|nr:hypothetical protein [Deltaproteobacteria bacterium]